MRKIDLEAEASFEDRKASGESLRANQSKFYWATALSEKRHKALTHDAISGKVALEIGCASGNDAVGYASEAKSYTGIDISEVAISNCKKLHLQNARFLCVDGHRLPLESNSIDCVIVNSLLHHLDLQSVFLEITRVLKRDGILIFREPLGTNPFFQLYRLLTPSARTIDERPFTFGDLKLMRSYFAFEDVQWFGFLSLMSAFAHSSLLRSMLSRIDFALSFSPLKYFFWQFSGIARIKGE